MDNNLLFIGGTSPACRYAAEYLHDVGIRTTDSPTEDARYTLLDIPSFGPGGQLRNGGDVDRILARLPEDIMICGGNLSNPKLETYETVDFLQDEIYLCENACITAECALDVALPYLSRTLRHCPVLIIGWGRIGKCLAQLLKSIGADVTVAARNPGHRAILHALGFDAVDLDGMADSLPHFRLIYNTVPHPILRWEQLSLCWPDCVKIELASKDGLEGDDVITARGLPGIHLPESSGKLIAETFLRLCYGR